MSKMDQIRKIVASKQYGKVEGSMVDLFSASGILSLYEALNKDNRAKYESMPVWKMQVMAMKLAEGGV